METYYSSDLDGRCEQNFNPQNSDVFFFFHTPHPSSNTIFFFFYVRKIGTIGKLQNTVRKKGFVEDYYKRYLKIWYF
jgi:hypothetical protein